MDVNDFHAFARRSIPSSDDTADIKKDLAKVKSEITEIQLVLEHDRGDRLKQTRLKAPFNRLFPPLPSDCNTQFFLHPFFENGLLLNLYILQRSNYPFDS